MRSNIRFLRSYVHYISVLRSTKILSPVENVAENHKNVQSPPCMTIIQILIKNRYVFNNPFPKAMTHLQSLVHFL